MYISEIIKELSEKLVEDGDMYVKLRSTETYYKNWVHFTDATPGHFEKGDAVKELPKRKHNRIPLKFTLVRDEGGELDIDSIFKFIKD